MEAESERRVGVAIDFSSCSRNALRWAIDNLARKGDYLVLITVKNQAYEEGEMQLWETSGSPLIPLSEIADPATMHKYNIKPDPDTLEYVADMAKQKELVVVLKIYWGDAREKLCEAVESLPLNFLVMGNRGLGTIQRAIMGSVSNYVVNNASCPVTVVKHNKQTLAS